MNRAQQLKLFGYWCKLTGLFDADQVGKTALRSFVQPPKPDIRPKQAAFLDQARQSTLIFEGKQVAVYEWGEAGAPYVFSAYGWAYNAGRWRHFAPTLVEAGYRFVGVDYQGHGRSEYAECDFPTMVRLLKQVILHFGRPELLLAHSFGAGLAIGMLSEIDPSLHPQRMALLAGFSDVAYIFRQYAAALGFAERHYESLVKAVEKRTGGALSSFDTAVMSLKLGHIQTLIAHDPQDAVTAFSNAERLAEYFPGAYLYGPVGAGHGFTDAESSTAVLDWLLTGQEPAIALQLENQDRPSHSRASFRSVFFR